MVSNVKVEDAVIARLKKQGQNFEVLVDCENALLVKSGEDIDMGDVLATEQIFNDSKKGIQASENAITQIFETEDKTEIAKEIIKKGEIQLTADHRKKVLEEKKKQIMSMIQRNGVDPKTHLPHPMTRIENAFETAKVKIDEFKDIKLQIQEIVKKLQPILPIKFETKEIQLTIPPEFASKSQYLLRSFGRLISEDWGNDGSLSMTIEIPGGMEEDLYEKINKVCSGNVQSKVIATK